MRKKENNNVDTPSFMAVYAFWKMVGEKTLTAVVFVAGSQLVVQTLPLSELRVGGLALMD